MAILEVRRHAMRMKPGQHLSRQGVSLARYVGKEIGPFSLVISSPLPRATETAIAMGFAIDRVIDALGEDIPDKLFSLISWPKAISEISKLVRDNEECNRYAQAQAAHWRNVLGQIADDEAALIISHGAIIELGAISLMPNADHVSWGNAIGYCEGFRFSSQCGELASEVLRVPEEHQIIQN